MRAMTAFPPIAVAGTEEAPNVGRADRRARLRRRLIALALVALYSMVIAYSVNTWIHEQTAWGLNLASSGPTACASAEQCANAWLVESAPSLLADNYNVTPGTRICRYNNLPITTETSAAAINAATRLTIIKDGVCATDVANMFEPVGPALIDLGVALISALIAVLVYLHATQRRLVWHTIGFLSSLVLAFGMLPAVTGNVVASVSEIVSASYFAVPLLIVLLWRLIFPVPHAYQTLWRIGRITSFSVILGGAVLIALNLFLAILLNSQAQFDFDRKWGLLFTAAAFVIVLGTVLLSNVIGTRGVRRDYARILGAGTLIAIVPLLVLTVLPAVFGAGPIVDGTTTSIAVVALPLSLAYIILRRELLGVDSLVRTSAEQGLRLLALALAGTLVVSGAARLFAVPRDHATAMVLPALVLGLLVPLIYAGVKWLVETALFPEVRRYRAILSNAAQQAGITGPAQIASELIGEVKLALPVRRAMLFVGNDTTGDFVEAPETTSATKDLRVFVSNHLLLTLLRRSPGVITQRDLGVAKAQVRERFARLTDTLPGADAAVGWDIFVPVVLRGRLVAILAVSPRDDGFDFSGTDRSLLLALANRRGLALDYARILVDLRAAYEQQKEVDQLKDQFIMTAHHELRTPLAGMVGYIELLHDLGPAGREAHREQVEHFIDSARRAGEELSDMVSTLLQANETLSQGANGEPVPLDLSALLRSVAANVDVAFNAKHPRITVAAPEQSTVISDQQAISRIVTNLLTNALKYSPTTMPVEIQMRWEPTINLAEIQVRDWGQGIPATEQGKIFERFVRLESALNSPVRGSGLGLYVVRTLAEKLGGAIWVESSGMPGEGSTFHFTLPIARNGVSDAPASATLTPTVRRLR